LQNSLRSDGEFFCGRYLAYILNLIVQEGLKVLGNVVDTIRDNKKCQGI